MAKVKYEEGRHLKAHRQMLCVVDTGDQDYRDYDPT
jgi:hypothetical protein